MGRKTSYEYDVLNRLTEIEYLPSTETGISTQPSGLPNPRSTYTYDDLSRLVTAANNVGTVAFAIFCYHSRRYGEEASGRKKSANSPHSVLYLQRHLFFDTPRI